MPERLLTTAQNCVVVPRFEKDHPIFAQPCLRQGGHEEIGLTETPQHSSSGARGDTGSEQAGGGAVYGSIGATGHLMQSSDGKAPLRQVTIDLGNMEWKDRSRTRADASDPFDTVPKLGDTGGVWP